MTSINIKLEKCWHKCFYRKDVTSRALDSNEINNARISLISWGRNIMVSCSSQNLHRMVDTNKPIAIPVRCVVDEMKELRQEFKDVVETVGHMREEQTDSTKKVGEFMNKFQSKIHQDTDMIAIPECSTNFLLPPVPDILLTQPPDQQQDQLCEGNSQPETKTSNTSFGSLVPSTTKRANFEILENVGGQNSIKFYVKMMSEYNGDPPARIFHSDKDKARKIKGKVTKMMDSFNKYSSDVQKKKMFDKGATAASKMIIAKSLQKKVQQQFLNDYKTFDIKVNEKLKKMGQNFTQDLIVSNYTTFAYEINKQKRA